MGKPVVSNTDPATLDLAALLGREEQYLEALFEDVAIAIEAGHEAWASVCLSELERALDAHFWLEERQLFPGLAMVEAARVTALRQEHERMRAELASLARSGPLRSASAASVRELVALLRAHADREGEVVYPWAEANLGPHVEADLKRRVRERLAALSERIRALRSAAEELRAHG